MKRLRTGDILTRRPTITTGYGAEGEPIHKGVNKGVMFIF